MVSVSVRNTIKRPPFGIAERISAGFVSIKRLFSGNEQGNAVVTISQQHFSEAFTRPHPLSALHWKGKEAI
jgi:hypothetical protein